MVKSVTSPPGPPPLAVAQTSVPQADTQVDGQAGVSFERVGSGGQAPVTTFVAGLMTERVVASLASDPGRYRAADGTPVNDGNITPAEQLLLERGDLRGFWLSRIHKDPVARLGLAMWGRSGDLGRAVGASERWGEMERWQPDLNVLSRVMLGVMAPDDVPLRPETEAELTRYWQWLGDAAMDKLRAALVEHGEPETTLDETLRTIGRAMATEHVNQVVRDGMCTVQEGHEPGLLSARQVTEYHRRVFESFGLPPATFGGTMFGFMIDLQLAVGAGSWLPGADPGEVP